MSNKPIEYERRTVKEWLLALLDGSLALPLFQRSYVWTDSKTSDLIMALLQGRPVGTMLLIDRYRDALPQEPTQSQRRELQRFAPRLLAGTEGKLNTCQELILDGQQRLTSLWRALELGTVTGMEETESHGRHAFLKVEDLSSSTLKPELVFWPSKSWAGLLRSEPKRAREDDLIPLYLFDPRSADPMQGPLQDPLLKWCAVACENEMEAGNDLWWRISHQLRSLLLTRNVWYAKLPKTMTRSQAIEVFVQVNRSSAVIRQFDIAVAEYDQGTGGRSLRREISAWAESNAYAEAFFGSDEEKMIPKVGELILKVACLQEGKAPTDKQYTSSRVLDRLRTPQLLKMILDGIEWTFDFLAEEKIWKDKHLPSAVPLRVLPALFPEYLHLRDSTDSEGRARRCVRAYLWRAFVTERYNQAANTRLKEDYEGLKKVLANLKGTANALAALRTDVPAFRESCPLPGVTALHDMNAPLAPPTQKNSLSRALLVASLHKGALDFASGEPISAGNVSNREAHHLFPRGFIKSHVEGKKQINHCLNYALVSGPTNKRIAARPPLRYLRDRYRGDERLTKGELKRRIESHIIPYGALVVREGRGTSGNLHPDQIKKTYAGFLRARAERMRTVIAQLADGSPV